MAAPPSQPALTPQFCFSTVYLRDFLRASRAVDDTITQHLNALVTPARAGFDPASTAHRASAMPSYHYAAGVGAPYSSSSSFSAPGPSPPACRAFRDAVLFPAWQARDDVIQYCTAVAQDAVAKDAAVAAGAALDEGASAPGQTAATPATPATPAAITERYDPYINRRQYALVEPQASLLASLVRQERVVETIVRARSWDVLQSRCGGGVVAAGAGDPGWEAALARWRQRQGR